MYQALLMSLANMHYLISFLITVLHVFFHFICNRYYSIIPILQMKTLKVRVFK